MFGADNDDNDEKLFLLEPVVVLERLQEASGYSVRKCRKLESYHRHFTASQKHYCGYRTKIKKHFQDNHVSKEERNVAEMTKHPKQSGSCSNHTRNYNHVNKSPKQIPEKRNSVEQMSQTRRNIEEERPHRCVQCGERFHTNILLAVHKRIHNNSEDESENNEDVDEISNIHFILDNRSKDPSVPVISAPEKNSKKFIIVHRDHDYTLGVAQNPALKRNEEKNKKQRITQKRDKKKGLDEVSVLFTCNQCPASFSLSWYLQLHMILLHFIHEKDTVIECPGCKSLWGNEDSLRQHIEKSHNSDLLIMTGEISSSLRVPTDALTGENKRYTKKKLSSQRCPAKPIPLGHRRTACDWKSATSSQKDEILDLVESELRHIVTERNKLGDHYTYSDIQRLGLEIAECLRVSDFLNGNPTKRWAQKILGSVGQISRPGKFRFVHNVNRSYLNAVTSLSTRGLSESTVFYAFELNVCSVQQNQIVQRLSGVEVEEDSVSAIISTNADGTVLLHPTFAYQGQIIDYKNFHSTDIPTSKTPPKDFFETPYFRQWFAQFLISIPKTRPVLLLVEGNVSQLPYSIILMARENDVHLVFLPSRKRFVHPHQLIQKSLVSPLIESFASEIEKFLRSHNAKSVHVQYFGSMFDSSWNVALQKAEISKSFHQSGFLPLPQTIRPLEEAAREYLDVVLFSQGSVSETDSSHTETSDGGTAILLVKPKTVSEDPSLSLQEGQVKTETVKEELEEELILPESDAAVDSMIEVKQEPMEYNIPDIPLPDRLEKFKIEYNNCANCNQFFHSNEDLTKHICAEDNGNNYSCTICDTEFAEEYQLLKHKCNLNLSDPVECDLHTCHICNMSFALKDTLKFHLATHRNNHLASPGELMRTKTGPILKEVSTKAPKQVSFELKDTSHLGRQISPSLSSSSRTVSPSSSASSRTLTASPSDLWAYSDDEACVKKDTNVSNTHTLPKPIKSIPIPKFIPPPLPEHDYLGQLYQKRTHSASASSLKKPGQTNVPISSITSSSQSYVLSRKQTRKVIRRIQLVSIESKSIKRLRK